MAYLTVGLLNAWIDHDRQIDLTSIEAELESQLSSQVITSVSGIVDTTSWVDVATTPMIIKSIIAMQYMGRFYQRVYIEDVNDYDFYGNQLLLKADKLLDQIISGEVSIYNEDGTIVDRPDNAIASYELPEVSAFSMELEF